MQIKEKFEGFIVQIVFCGSNACGRAAIPYYKSDCRIYMCLDTRSSKRCLAAFIAAILFTNYPYFHKKGNFCYAKAMVKEMKATGIVRRIDDLGRVVIPKEIRRTMRIREGDPLEIYTDREGEVIFKKYSPIGELVDFASQYAESLYKTCGIPVAVCDRDSVVAAAGISKKEFLDKKISQDVDAIIEGRSLYTAPTAADSAERILLSEDDRTGIYVVCAQPIFTEGDIIGCVAAVTSEEDFPARIEKSALETEVKLIQTAAAFLGRQLEN